jgi:hypothetical protein
VQPASTLQQVSQPRQIVQTQAVQHQQPAVISQAPVQQSATSGSTQTLVPQQPAVHASNPASMPSPMGMSHMGMGSPFGMMGAMNPMAAMMGPGMGPMGMGMGMGMPFMSYDTFEDTFIDPDTPSRPMVAPGAAMASAAAASRLGAGMTAGAVGAAISAPSLPVTGQAASPASVGLGSASVPVAGTSSGVPAPQAPLAAGGVSASQVNPSVIQSALQTALSRVQQRQTAQAPAVG